jgi:hypothetical protein
VPGAWCQGSVRLTSMSLPAGIPEDRWQLFLDDCWRFMNTWASTAAKLGWKPADLFGVGRTGPTKRVDLAGVLWLLEGREIAAIERHGIAIRCASGSIQTYRPARVSVERILAWQLPPVLNVGGYQQAERLLDDYPLEAA